MQAINWKIKKSMKYLLEVVSEFSSNSGQQFHIQK